MWGCTRRHQGGVGSLTHWLQPYFPGSPLRWAAGWWLSRCQIPGRYPAQMQCASALVTEHFTCRAPGLTVLALCASWAPIRWALLYPTGAPGANLLSLKVLCLGSEGLWDLERLQQSGQPPESHGQTYGYHHKETD